MSFEHISVEYIHISVLHTEENCSVICMLMFSISRFYPLVSQSGLVILSFCQQCEGIYSCPCQHLVLMAFCLFDFGFLLFLMAV